MRTVASAVGPNRATSHALAIALCPILLAAPVHSFEKSAEPFDDNRDRNWQSGGITTHVYYNTCTGWTWAWDLQPGLVHRVGVVFEEPVSRAAEEMRLALSWHHFPRTLPAGYGFTGSIEVFEADSMDCPTGALLATRSFLPRKGWNELWWDMVTIPPRFALVYKTSGAFAPGYGIEHVTTDHPAAGPTGPTACGDCYPASRRIHSFYYGTSAAPLCPGSTLNDGVCDAELLWEAVVEAVSPTSVDALSALSWGGIKGLYR